jgi:hypothetical protein
MPGEPGRINSQFYRRKNMKIRKNTHGPFRGFAAVLFLGSLLLGACSNPLHENEDPSGGGYVQVILSPDVAARTLLPSASELFYTLTFTRTSPSPVTVIETLGGGTSKTVGLEAGTWDLAVYGYSNPADAYPLNAPAGTAAAEGYATGIDVSGNNPVPVELSAVQTGTGTLRYSLSYPASPPVSEITLVLEKRGGGYSRTLSLTPGNNYDGYYTNGQLPLPSGYYNLVFYLYNGRIAAPADLVHIYDNLETPASFTLNAADFAESPDISALETALAAARTARDETVVSASGVGVDSSRYWISQAGMDALEAAIAAAEAITALRGAGMIAADISTAAGTLNTAKNTFTGARTWGAYNPAGDTDLGLFKGASRISAAGTTLAGALEWLRDNNASINDDDSYTVVLGADEDLGPWRLGGWETGTNRAITNKSNITLTLKGKGMERTISLNSNGSLFFVDSGVNLVLDEHISLRGRPANTNALVQVYFSNGALTMEQGSKITGNTSSNYRSGGVLVDYYGTFTMNGGEISGNSSSQDGGGVFVSENGTFTMNDGKISGNSSYYGGGVYVWIGTFIMNGGEISGNAAYDGGVFVSSGTFTMNGGEISGNSSSYRSGGVYVDISGMFSGTFTMSGGARVNPDNPVYLAYSSDSSAALTIGGAFTGPLGPVALVDPGIDIGFIGKTAVKWAEGQSGTLPVDRIAFSSGWTADSNGVLGVNSAPLTPSGAGAYLGPGKAHFYRFSPVLNSTYTITLTKDDYYNYIYAAAVWADGSGTLMTYDYYYDFSGTSPAFIAGKPGDIIIMVYNYTGNYTVRYNEE